MSSFFWFCRIFFDDFFLFGFDDFQLVPFATTSHFPNYIFMPFRLCYFGTPQTTSSCRSGCVHPPHDDLLTAVQGIPPVRSCHSTSSCDHRYCRLWSSCAGRRSCSCHKSEPGTWAPVPVMSRTVLATSRTVLATSRTVLATSKMVLATNMPMSRLIALRTPSCSGSQSPRSSMCWPSCFFGTSFLIVGRLKVNIGKLNGAKI